MSQQSVHDDPDTGDDERLDLLPLRRAGAGIQTASLDSWWCGFGMSIAAIDCPTIATISSSQAAYRTSRAPNSISQDVTQY